MLKNNLTVPESAKECLPFIAVCDGILKTAENMLYRDGFYWVPLIALFSGMRLNEICQLTTADIITKDEVVCFCINDKNGKRVKTILPPASHITCH